MTFSFVMMDEVTKSLLALKGAERAYLIKSFAQIAANPYRRPDFIVRNAGERDLQVAVFTRWRITYWVDHYAREVRITHFVLSKE
jgi:hypothetical protein